MTDPTPLSPIAQAVLNAYKIASDGHYTDAGEWIQDHAGQIAAALRAAALEVVLNKDKYQYADWQMADMIMNEIQAIADELEGTND